jgi:hypothetical protein
MFRRLYLLVPKRSTFFKFLVISSLIFSLSFPFIFRASLRVLLYWHRRFFSRYFRQWILLSVSVWCSFRKLFCNLCRVYQGYIKNSNKATCSKKFQLYLRSSFFWDVPQRRVAVSYRRFRTTYGSHLQGTACPWNMGPIDCSETSVTDCHSMVSNMAKDGRFSLHRGVSLKSRIQLYFFCLTV